MFSAGLPAKDCQSAENHGNLRLCNIPFNLAIVSGWTRRESGLCGVLNPGTAIFKNTPPTRPHATQNSPQKFLMLDYLKNGYFLRKHCSYARYAELHGADFARNAELGHLEIMIQG
jgi:hypothetical protein